MNKLQHLAVIMDGNGRWAQRRGLPRIAGHDAGVEALRRLIKAAVARKIAYLTVFAFSTENWSRSQEEVDYLLNKLMIRVLKRELPFLQQLGVKVSVIGRRDRFAPALVQQIEHTEQETRSNTVLNLIIALDYGGRWEILEACRRLLSAQPNPCLAKEAVASLTEETFRSLMAPSDGPDPDLLIRTGAEYRISNFLLWQLAYTELYFTDVYWPDFDEQELDRALVWYQHRQRRFGKVP